jgi:hypothetical protein
MLLIAVGCDDSTNTIGMRDNMLGVFVRQFRLPRRSDPTKIKLNDFRLV